MKKSVQITLGVLAAAIVAVALVFGVKALLPKGDSGEKSISIQVVVSEEDVREFTVNTTEEFLGPALENEGLIEGEIRPFRHHGGRREGRRLPEPVVVRHQGRRGRLHRRGHHAYRRRGLL